MGGTVGFAEMIGFFTAHLVIDKINRRKTMVISFILTQCFCFCFLVFGFTSESAIPGDSFDTKCNLLFLF